MIKKFEGKKPDVHKDAFIAETASLVGDVSVGEQSSVWYSAVIRADQQSVKIGNRTSIQDNATIHVCPGHPTVIKDGVTVGHNVIVHGCTIESNCIIGMGAILLNGCKIGKNSVIGAGAVVMENAVIPPQSLAVGIPAKVIRKLTEQDIQKIKENAQEYVKLTEQYLKQKS
ncbi:MAG: gamma carbonic anhydrase family protein [Candidatus Aenigmatarchaeota archaeon]